MIERLREEDVDAKKIGVGLNKLKMGGVENVERGLLGI